MSLILDHVSYTYEAETSMEIKALNDINLVIPDGQFIGLIGHTGSGKSTLVQHLNGLVRATEGAVYYNGADIDDSDYNKRELRSKVGLVFQRMFFRTYVLVPKTWGCRQKKWSFGLMKR